jgi:hypothetical protein
MFGERNAQIAFVQMQSLQSSRNATQYRLCAQKRCGFGHLSRRPGIRHAAVPALETASALLPLGIE